MIFCHPPLRIIISLYIFQGFGYLIILWLFFELHLIQIPYYVDQVPTCYRLKHIPTQVSLLVKNFIKVSFQVAVIVVVIRPRQDTSLINLQGRVNHWNQIISSAFCITFMGKYRWSLIKAIEFSLDMFAIIFHELLGYSEVH